MRASYFYPTSTPLYCTPTKAIFDERSPDIDLKEILGVNEARKYQRYVVNNGGDTPAQVEVIVEGELVRLVNFSLGGLYILSKIPFSPGTISFSVDFGNRGKIALTGTVVRVRKEGDMWGVAIDLSKTYELNTLLKI